jgi:sulfatase modifying factor 1
VAGGYVLPTGSLASCEGGYSGLFDMSGNVWEWTSTCTDNQWYCRLRGGSFRTDYFGLQCSYRQFNVDPTTHDLDWGFRCCRSL